MNWESPGILIQFELDGLPFPLGGIVENSPGTIWATSIESLPWLILRDAKVNVAAEGFSLEALDAKLEALNR